MAPENRDDSRREETLLSLKKKGGKNTWIIWQRMFSYGCLVIEHLKGILYFFKPGPFSHMCSCVNDSYYCQSYIHCKCLFLPLVDRV